MEPREFADDFLVKRKLESLEGLVGEDGVSALVGDAGGVTAREGRAIEDTWFEGAVEGVRLGEAPLSELFSDRLSCIVDDNVEDSGGKLVTKVVVLLLDTTSTMGGWSLLFGRRKR